MNQCLITGCELFVEAEGKMAHGDLHRAGSALVFNAVVDEKGEATWKYGVDPFGAVGRIVTIHNSFPYFERRGIIAFDKFNARFNVAAIEYLAKWDGKLG